MTTYTTLFNVKATSDSTREEIIATFEYCQDFTGDGRDDIRVTLSLSPGSNSGTEDLIGVAFQVQADALPSGLTVTQINPTVIPGSQPPYTPTFVIGANQVSDAGPLDPGFNTSGGASYEPYDIGIKFSDQGAADGIVQTASFVLSADAHLDAEALLENTFWWLRLQSTNLGQGSAKMEGELLDLPTCGTEPPPPPPHEGGEGNTPGFWKNHAAIFQQETGLALTAKYEAVFGINVGVVMARGKVVSDSDPTFYDALNASGGGEAAFLRATAAAWANATSDDVNYAIDESRLIANGFAEAGVTDPARRAALLDILDTIDADDDGLISASELIATAQDVYTNGGSFSLTDRGDVALALDAMNNMFTVERDAFFA